MKKLKGIKKRYREAYMKMYPELYEKMYGQKRDKGKKDDKQTNKTK